MSDLVGEAVVELRGDNRRLKADIREVAKEGGKDFSKGFDKETRRGLGKSFRDSLLSAASRATAVLNIAGAVGPAILAIGSAASAAAAGVTAVAGALGPALVAGAAAGVGALAALGVAAIGVKVAFSGLDKAIAGDADALAALSPPARNFAKTITGLQPRLESIRAVLQRGLFKSLTPDVRRLGNQLFPLLRTAARDLGNQLGSLADQGTKMVTSGPWRRDFANIAAANTRNVGLFGRAGLQLADAFRSLFATAQPLIHTFAQWTLEASRSVNAAVQAGRASGKLQAFWAKASTVGAQLAAILGNLSVGLFRILRIGAGAAGTGMLDNLEGMSRNFREWTASATGIAKISEFFKTGRTNLEAMGKLLGATAKGLSSLGSGKQLAPLLDQIRTQLLPPILDFLRNANVSGALSSLVDALASVARVFASLSASDSSMKAFSETLRAIADAALFVTQHVPGASTALSILFTALGGAAALKLVGLGGLVRALGAAFGGLATKAAAAAGAVDLETGAITANSVAHRISMSTAGTFVGVKSLETGAWVRSTAAARIYNSVVGSTAGKLGIAAVGVAGLAGAAQKGGGAFSVLGGAASGALTGAALGSFLPGPGTAVGAIIGGLGGLATGLFTAGDAAKTSGEGAKVAAGSWESLRSTLDSVTGATTAATRAMVFQDLEANGTLKTLKSYGISARDAVTAITKGGPAGAAFNAQLNAQKTALQGSIDAAVKYRDSLDAGTTDPGRLKAANDAVAAIKRTNGARIAGLSAVQKELGLTAKAVVSKKAEIAATRTFSKALNTLPRGVVTKVKAQVLARPQIVDLIRKYDLARKDVRTLIKENGGKPTKAMIDSIIARAKELDRQHANPKVTVNAGPALNTIRTVKNTIDGIHDKTVTLHIRQDGSFRTAGGTEGRASGGPVSAGRTYLVGEDGPELLTLGRVGGYVQNATDTAKLLKGSKKISKSLGTSIIAGLLAGLKAGPARLVTAMQKLSESVNKLGLGKAAKKQIDALTTAYTKGTDRLKQLATDIAAFKTDFVTTALSSVQVRGFDAKDIVELFTQDTARQGGFLRGLAALGKAGLNKSILGQLQQAGVGALPQIQGILAGGKTTIAALNKQTANLTAVAKTAGATVSETMFGSGTQMASSLIAGLKSKQSDLVKQMRALARAAVAAIRAELRMHSPSKVLTRLGENGGTSLAGGFGNTERTVESAASRLAKAAIRGSSIPGAARATTSSAQAVGLGGGIHVHMPTGDPEAAALAVWDRLVAAGVGG